MIRKYSNILLALLTLFSLSCKKDSSNVDDLKPSDLIWFSAISKNEIVADSSNTVEIEISISQKADKDIDTLELSTSLGYFENDQKQILLSLNSYRKAKVLLHTTTEAGTAYLRASVNGVIIDTAIQFLRSYPDAMELFPVQQIINSDTANLKLQLYRDNGIIGNNIKVNLSCTPIDTTGIQLGLPAFITVDNAEIQFEVYNIFKWKHRFMITASVLKPDGVSVNSQALLVFE